MRAKFNGIGSAFLFTMILLLSWEQYVNAEDQAEKAEIFLTNNTSLSVIVTVEPIGMLFNDLFEYSLHSSSSDALFPNRPIIGIQVTVPAGHQVYPVVNHIGTHDPYSSGGLLSTEEHIGYAQYRLTISGWGYVTVDFSDSDYPDLYSSLSLDRDIWLTLEPGFQDNTLYWRADPQNRLALTPNEDIVEIWDQTRIGGPSKIQNRTGFKISSGEGIPLDGSDEPVTHITPGKLFVNLEVQANAIVLSGKSFIIQEPGTQILFSPNKKLTVDGTLTAHGTSANPIVFTANGTSWNGIYFASGSSPAGWVLSSNPTRMLSLSRRQRDTECFSLCAPRLCEIVQTRHGHAEAQCRVATARLGRYI